MNTLATYQDCIKKVLQQYHDYTRSQDEIETEIVTDVEHDHYQIVHVGWQHKRRVYGCAFHLDIKDKKVWIQYNGTEYHIAEELVKLGVPKTDIVLGFHSPSRRQFTGYALGMVQNDSEQTTI